MSNLREIAELAWRQVFPNPTDEAKNKKEEFFATARTEYAYQLWLKIMAEKREEGYLMLPSYLFDEKDMDVVNNEIDISSLKAMKNLPADVWVQKVGELNCECAYVKTTLNNAQVLCDDDSLPEGSRLWYVLGKKIKFPNGTHKKVLPVTYANSGENIDGKVEVDDVIGALIRRALVELYLGKTGKEDKTNNSNSDL